MFRPKKIITLILLSAVVCVSLLRVLGILKGRRYYYERAPEFGKFSVIKKLPLSSPQDLSEFDQKLMAKRPTDYSIVEADGGKCLKAASTDSASVLLYKQRLTRESDTIISWDWKVETFPERRYPESFAKKEFDFAAQIYVVFYSKFFIHTKAIQYVWADELPVGTKGDNPYTPNVKMMVLESGPSDVWKEEKRDIRKDFFELFGEGQEKDIEAIALMTDSDSTGSTAAAYYKNIDIGAITAADSGTKRAGMSNERGASVEVKKKTGTEKKDFRL